MALVVLLRGVNVGGHRRFRPARLAADLDYLGVVNIGAAGTFVVRQPVTRAGLRAELARRLPFETEVMIVSGKQVRGLVARDPFAGLAERTDIVRFVSVLARTPRTRPATPIQLPPEGRWLLQILGREGRFVTGLYRRQMKAIGYLSRLDTLFGAPVTTRNWNTIVAVADVLGGS